MALSLEQLINQHYGQLNENDLYALNFISQNIELCIDSTVSEIAAKANISASSIIRTTKKIGFKGYSEFRFFLKEENERLQNMKPMNSEYFYPSTLLEDVKATVRLFEEDKSVTKIYDLIKHAKKIYAYATGYGQNLMLKEFARCLWNCGIHLIIVPEKIELELISRDITSDDLLFVIALSGNMGSIEPVLKSIALKQTPIVSVTIFSRNSLAYLADHNIYYQLSTMNDVSHLNNSSFSTLSLVLSLVYEGYVNSLKK
ncbi:MurR/RpiR family transcriptional regulator [Enterococcus saccharolyticus]|uniref:MurR/RpiR family transcriptional regulator n=1 Tax=Enterococcus saccharolyticus TaxID=41997 RepID=UPI001E2DFDB1|nr:MurR/RpiR family transcriptional regulator [Enterococcus saccharolyticus]MCD5002382.1 MurR/RpiR family transcriptional regulator [Enterococcus saccharolyticus]